MRLNPEALGGLLMVLVIVAVGVVFEGGGATQPLSAIGYLAILLIPAGAYLSAWKEHQAAALGLIPDYPFTDAWKQRRARARTPRASSLKTLLVTTIGRVARVVFFCLTAAGLLVWLASADWSAYNTPLAGVTLFQIGGAIVKSLGFLIAGLLWLRWAFAPGKKDYTAWARFGEAVGLLVLIGIALRR